MSAPAHTLRLGTRGSRLAVAQSRLVASALEAVHPGLRVELLTLSTRGDRDLATPLPAVRDKHFFSAEIDAALLRGDIDLAVHSRKDLDGPRPAGLVTAAIPLRADPRDVVLFRANVLDRLRAGAALRVGTSSARRARHVAEFLESALPRAGPPPRIDCRSLRGPVDQRLGFLQADGDDALDAVVLALAGLDRLWGDPAGRAAIAEPLAELRWMVLPLSTCPAAPGQGALAVECRADDATTHALLGAIHDEPTAAAVAAEYATAAAAVTPERAALGATAVQVPALGQLLFARGPGIDTGVLQWPAPPAPDRARAWDGGVWHRACKPRPVAQVPASAGHPAVFVAHWRALPRNWPPEPGRRTWVSGWQSWQRLSAAGHWVEGCADGLGFDALGPTLACAVLGLPPLQDWLVLTRAGAEPTWADSGVGSVLGSYVMEPPDTQTVRRLRAEASRATHFFWSSREQFLALRDCLPADARHACGTGKTFRALQELGLRPCAFPNRDAWQAWLG